MDTARFSKVIEACGKPDIHLLLVDPATDKTLQAAVRSNRVMTIYQEPGNKKSDHGVIGFEEGKSRQFLVFPKTLEPFVGQRIVGIKYDLLESEPAPKKEAPVKRAPDTLNKPADAVAEQAKRATIVITRKPAVVPSPAETKKQRPMKSAPGPEAEPEKIVAQNNLIEFHKPASDQTAASDELNELKRQVRKAMDFLEEGKQVAAFNLLKEIIEQ